MAFVGLVGFADTSRVCEGRAHVVVRRRSGSHCHTLSVGSSLARASCACLDLKTLHNDNRHIFIVELRVNKTKIIYVTARIYLIANTRVKALVCLVACQTKKGRPCEWAILEGICHLFTLGLVFCLLSDPAIITINIIGAWLVVHYTAGLLPESHTTPTEVL